MARAKILIESHASNSHTLFNVLNHIEMYLPGSLFLVLPLALLDLLLLLYVVVLIIVSFGSLLGLLLLLALLHLMDSRG